MILEYNAGCSPLILSLIFLRDEVPENAREGDARQQDALHPPFEEHVLLLVVIREIEEYRLVHLLFYRVKMKRVWPDSSLVPPFICRRPASGESVGVRTRKGNFYSELFSKEIKIL